jgi:phosphoribosyl 1,2-cyclic phosphate phosphodiesterase
MEHHLHPPANDRKDYIPRTHTTMQITFLGTAAAEGFPNAFCACANCAAARALRGPSLRKRSALLLNDDLLIDLGPDVMAAAVQHNVSLAQVQYCIQTHEHADHLDPSHFLSRSPDYGVRGAPRLHYYASAPALAWVERLLVYDLPPGLGLQAAEVQELLNLTVHPIDALQEFDAGPYHVLSVAANHAPNTTALLHVITHGGRTLFYATDTHELPEATWQALAAYGRPFHAVVMDHTYGPGHAGEGHLSAAQFLAHVARMRDLGLLAAGAQVYATHIAHETNPPHPELAAYAAEHGYAVAYDGLVVEV